ncbi:MAG: hypothetical protein HQK76_16805 [Desulfobacterales bacterium]|nr:hypothetical protein [Desulfobacterales bacterium]
MKKLSLLSQIITCLGLFLLIGCSGGGGGSDNSNDKPESYTLKINIVGNGSVSISPSGGVYDAGTTITITAIPDSDWIFKSWSGSFTGAKNPQPIIMDSNKTIIANFDEAYKYSLSGTAASGYPIIGTVYVKDANYTIFSTQTNNDGSFKIDIKNLTPPYLLWAEGTANGKFIRLYSIAYEAGTVNISNATHIIVAMALKADPYTYYNSKPSSASPKEDAIKTAKEKIFNLLKEVFPVWSIPTDFDIIKGSFQADGTKFDKLLETINMTCEGKIVQMSSEGTIFFSQNIETGTIEIELTPSEIKGAVTSANVGGNWKMTTVGSSSSEQLEFYLVIAQKGNNISYKSYTNDFSGDGTGSLNGTKIYMESTHVYKKKYLIPFIFDGNVNGKQASGTWKNQHGQSGTWKAEKSNDVNFSQGSWRKNEYWDDENSGKINKIIYYTYDYTEKITKKEIDRDSDDAIEDVIYLTYNSEGRLSKTEQDTNSDNAINVVEYYTYDSKGNVTRKEVDWNNDGKSDEINIYTYDEKGNVSKFEEDWNGDAEYDASCKCEYTFNSNGSISKKIEKCENEEFSSSYAYSYVYDYDGNLIKVIEDEFNDGIIDRVIYYLWENFIKD